MPCPNAPRLLTPTPNMKTGRRPNRAINNDAGTVVIIEVINWSESGNVASHATGANSAPTSAVLMMFTFILVIDNA